jgi:hypothetical protein
MEAIQGIEQHMNFYTLPPLFFCDNFWWKVDLVITIGMFSFLFNGDVHKNLNTNFLYMYFIILVILYQKLQVAKLILFSIVGLSLNQPLYHLVWCQTLFCSCARSIEIHENTFAFWTLKKSSLNILDTWLFGMPSRKFNHALQMHWNLPSINTHFQ